MDNSRILHWIRQVLPDGRRLPDGVWRSRDRLLRTILWLHLPALAALASSAGRDDHELAELAVLCAVAAAATMARSRAWRDGLTSFGLLSCSALLVHLFRGAIEMHFHFFVVLALIALYQDWRPYLLAVGYVLVHHLVLGMLSPSAVFNHPAAIANPWRWALVHALFVLAAASVHLAFWRANELTDAEYRRARHQSLHDPLTGLANRRGFLERLERVLGDDAAPAASVAVIMVDLDGFKEVNDNHGHDAGDQLLIDVADRLQACVRPGDTVARLGGDEFTVLMERLPGPEPARSAAARIVHAVRRPIAVDAGEVRVSASVGLAQAKANERDPHQLLRAADGAMYRVKHGRWSEPDVLGVAAPGGPEIVVVEPSGTVRI